MANEFVFPDNGTPRFSAGIVQTVPARFQYPAQIGSPPFEKWILFEVKSGRHVGRQQIIPESATEVDRTLASVSLYMSETALKDEISVCYDKNDYGPFVGAAIELLAQSSQNLFDSKFAPSESTGGGTIEMLKTAIRKGASVGGDVLGDVTNAITSNWKDALAADLRKAVDAVAGSGTTGSIFGTRVNPRTDLLFNTQEYRSRQLEFLLIPRNLDEARAIDNIVHLFQFYSLPAYLGQADNHSKVSAFLLGFPYEFNITLLHQDKVMEHVNKIGRSVLRNVSVDHAAGGKAAFVEVSNPPFAQTQLYPVATKLTLEFQEVRLLGRDSEEIDRAGTTPLDDPRLR